MLVEAANRCGADTLLSEDMVGGMRYGATTVVNPFV
jgi:predicted nucleic acid-binding protein